MQFIYRRVELFLRIFKFQEWVTDKSLELLMGTHGTVYALRHTRAPCLQTRQASLGMHKEEILKVSQIDKKGAIVEGVERIPAKHELTGWVDGDDAYMLLKVGQFECTVKAHRHSTDFLALSEGLLGALKDAEALPAKKRLSTSERKPFPAAKSRVA
jgi:hypothetical protein